MPFDKIFENGIIKMKNNYFIKIIKINPINFNLKTILEKETILNSYKTFLKTCDFDIQILIQSEKEDLSKNISNIKLKIEKEKNNKINKISKEYINFIIKNNLNKKTTNKNFYLIINCYGKELEEKYIFENLNDKYYKIKECLLNCGNMCTAIEEKEKIQEIIFKIFNYKKQNN